MLRPPEPAVAAVTTAVPESGGSEAGGVQQPEAGVQGKKETPKDTQAEVQDLSAREGTGRAAGGAAKECHLSLDVSWVPWGLLHTGGT